MTVWPRVLLLSVLLLVVALFVIHRTALRVAVHYRWPAEGTIHWRPWPGRMEFTGHFTIKAWSVVQGSLVLDIMARGRLRLPGPFHWQLVRRFRLTLPLIPGQGPTPRARGPARPGLIAQVEALQWSTVIGVGNAAWTAILTGAAWCLKGLIVAQLSGVALTTTPPPQLVIEPRFNAVVFDTAFDCILVLRLRDIIRAADTIRSRPKPRQPKGVKNWSIPSRAS